MECRVGHSSCQAIIEYGSFSLQESGDGAAGVLDDGIGLQFGSQGDLRGGGVWRCLAAPFEFYADVCLFVGDEQFFGVVGSAGEGIGVDFETFGKHEGSRPTRTIRAENGKTPARQISRHETAKANTEK